MHFPTWNKFKNNEELSTDFAVGVIIHIQEQFQIALKNIKNTVQKNTFKFLKIHLKVCQ